MRRRAPHGLAASSRLGSTRESPGISQEIARRVRALLGACLLALGPASPLACAQHLAAPDADGGVDATPPDDGRAPHDSAGIDAHHRHDAHDVARPTDARSTVDADEDAADAPIDEIDAGDVSDAATVRDGSLDSGADAGLASGCALGTQPPMRAPSPGVPTVVMNTWVPLGAAGAIMDHGCELFAMGSDHVYPLTITARSSLQFVINASDGAPVLSLRRACAESSTELACDSLSGAALTAGFRATLDPGTYYLVADEIAEEPDFAAGGDYSITVSSYAEAPNARCTSASLWTAGTVESATTAGGGTSDRSCNTFTANGPEVFYRYTLPANTRAVLTATPMGAPAWRPYLRVRDDCASSTCVSAGPSPSNGSAAVVVLNNYSATTRAYIVSVGALDLASGGAFSLTDSLSSIAPLAPRAQCSTAPTVGPLSVLENETTVGTVDTRTTFNCQSAGGSGGTLAYYRMSVPPGRTASVTVTPELSFDVALRLFVGCAPSTCATYRSSLGAGGIEQASYRNTSGTDQDLVIAVGGSSTGSTGRFDLEARLLPAAPTNLLCSTPRPLTEASPAIAQNQADATTPNTAAACEPTASGNVLHYTINVAANRTAVIRAIPYTSSADPVLRVLDACGVASCVASANAGFGGSAEEVAVTNSAAAARDYIVTLGSRSPTAAGVFDLRARIIAQAANASCATPRTLANGEVLTNQDTNDAIERRSFSCGLSSPSGGALLYYQVTIPAGRTGVVRALAQGRFDPAIRVFQGCAPSSCTNYRNATGVASEEIQAITNSTASAQTYTIAIGSAASGEIGRFDVSYALVAAAATNTSCALARPLSPVLPALSQNQLTALVPNADASCDPGATGNVLFYALTVPPSQTAVVTAAPLASSIDPVLRAFDSCSSATCISSASGAFSGSNEQLVLHNPDASPKDYVVTLGSRSLANAGAMDLTVRFASTSANASCSTPTPIATGTTIYGQDTSSAVERRTTSCAGTAAGAPLLFYTLTVGPGATGRVRVTPSPTFDPTIRVFATCAPAACAAYRNGSSVGAPEEVAWTNAGTSAQAYIVAVGGANADEVGTFAITRE